MEWPRCPQVRFWSGLPRVGRPWTRVTLHWVVTQSGNLSTSYKLCIRLWLAFSVRKPLEEAFPMSNPSESPSIFCSTVESVRRTTKVDSNVANVIFRILLASFSSIFFFSADIHKCDALPLTKLAPTLCRMMPPPSLSRRISCWKYSSSSNPIQSRHLLTKVNLGSPSPSSCLT